MMAYEQNNNSPFAGPFDPFEPSHIIDGKLNNTANLHPGGLATQMQPGFLQQQYISGNHQTNIFTNVQQTTQQTTQLNTQAHYLQNNNLGLNNNMNAMNNNMNPRANAINSFQQPTLMSSMATQPLFQASSFASHQPQNQPQRSVPNFIAFPDNCNNAPVKPLLSNFNPFQAIEKTIESSNIPIHALEPVPMAEKAKVQLRRGDAEAKPTSNTMIPRSISKSKRLLPADFQPSGNYVICGNKRKYFESKGNIRFREVCKLFLQEYVQAPTKIEKSAVVTKVMSILREDCPEGAFVSPQGGRWYAVSERTAREKIGTYFRDCLSDSYKSSAKNKIARRKIIKKAIASTTNSTANSATNSTNNSASNNNDDEGSLESISFYDVDDLTQVPL